MLDFKKNLESMQHKEKIIQLLEEGKNLEDKFSVLDSNTNELNNN